MFNDDARLGDARDWLRERALGDGDHCPCCQQFAKVYRRQIGSAMARALIVMWRKAGRDPFHMPTVLGHRGGDPCKLTYWGLIEDAGDTRDDGGRAGWWTVTELGELFANGLARVPRYAFVYDSRCMRVEGDPVTIQDCLGEGFDLRELLDTPAIRGGALNVR
jgi:hypothetical protein